MTNPRSSNLEVQASRARPPLDVVLNLLAVIVWWGCGTDALLAVDPSRPDHSVALESGLLPPRILWIPAPATRCVLHYGRRGIRPIALVLLPVALYLASEVSGEGWIGSGLKITACVIWVWAFIELESWGHDWAEEMSLDRHRAHSTRLTAAPADGPRLHRRRTLILPSRRQKPCDTAMVSNFSQPFKLKTADRQDQSGVKSIT